jgi:phasin family protein
MAAAKDSAKTIDAFAADAQKAMTENMEKAQKSMTDFAAFGQDTVDAIMKSQNVAAKAIEEINAEVVAFSKKTMEEGVAHAKDLSSAQTVTDLLEKQAGFAKLSFDSMMKQTAKMNELMAAAAKEAMEPINARMTAAADMMKGSMA